MVCLRPRKTFRKPLISMKKSFSRLTRLLLLCTLLALISCSHLKSSTTTSSNDLSSPANTAASSDDISPDSESSKVKTVDFAQSKDTLYDLLVAEIAAQRDQLGVTLLNYLDQAQATRDLGVIKRALNAAQFVKDAEAVQQLAMLWTEVDPADPQPRQILTYQFTMQKNYADAMAQIEQLITMDADSRVEALAIGSLQLPDAEKTEILTLYEQLSAKHPDNNDIRYSRAIVLRGLKRFDESRDLLKQVLEQDKDFEPAYLLLTNVLYEKGEKAEAEKIAKDSFKQFPRNQSIGRIYATILIEQRKLDAAESVFEDMIETFPDITALRLSLALVMLENGKEDAAKGMLLELRDAGLHQNESNYYLGRIAEKNQQTEEAIQYYSVVTDGPHFENALQHLAFLLVQQNRLGEISNLFAGLRETFPARANLFWRIQFDVLHKGDKKAEALEVLNQALDSFPEDSNLRYARAMLREQNGDIAGMEADLRSVLEREPQNPIALNALGYTLADRNERLNEALIMIGTAMSIDKTNPAIMDSMGWVLYRLGKLQEALAFLVQSYDLNKDPEIAAHLAEVLMVTGQTREAKIIMTRAYRIDPKHRILNDTIKRVAPELYDEMQDANNEVNTDADLKINLEQSPGNPAKTHEESSAIEPNQ